MTNKERKMQGERSEPLPNSPYALRCYLNDLWSERTRTEKRIAESDETVQDWRDLERQTDLIGKAAAQLETLLVNADLLFLRGTVDGEGAIAESAMAFCSMQDSVLEQGLLQDFRRMLHRADQLRKSEDAARRYCEHLARELRVLEAAADSDEVAASRAAALRKRLSDFGH